MDFTISRSVVSGHASLTIVVRDVSDWKRAEQASEWQRQILESIATGIELRDVLASIALFIEAQCPGVECAIHLLDDYGVTLISSCAPSMPLEFLDLAGTARGVMKALGVGRIEDVGLCTACESKRFYSHRRDGVTGRQAGIAMRL